jgi:hypothetical protein
LVPSTGQFVKSIEENSVLKKAFNLMPGTKFNWSVKTKNRIANISWEVFTNQYNRSYIYCHTTKSVAYFQYNGIHFCFTHFEGDRESLLYNFYLAAFRVPLVHIEGYTSTDSLPVNHTFKGWRLFLHDFTAAFFMYLKSGSSVTTRMNGPEFDAESFEYDSIISGYTFNRLIWVKEYKLIVYRNNSLKFIYGSSDSEAICESY